MFLLEAKTENILAIYHEECQLGTNVLCMFVMCLVASYFSQTWWEAPVKVETDCLDPALLTYQKWHLKQKHSMNKMCIFSFFFYMQKICLYQVSRCLPILFFFFFLTCRYLHDLLFKSDSVIFYLKSNNKFSWFPNFLGYTTFFKS